MKSPDDPGIVPAPTQFAVGDILNGDDLKRRIMAYLKDRLPDLYGAHVTVIGNTAALRGAVRSPQEKRLCVEYCRHVPGVTKIVDNLSVADETAVRLDPDDDPS
jgi:osmotically-inducible protein OsmY